MSETKRIRLAGRAARANAVNLCTELPEGWSVTFAPPRRSLDQNAKLWAALTDIARQVEWHGQKLEPAEWKDMATAALKRQRVVPGIEGGFVVLGSSTSRMGKAEMTELIEFLLAFGAERGVVFDEYTPTKEPGTGGLAAPCAIKEALK
jgi:hypothetical protein